MSNLSNSYEFWKRANEEARAFEWQLQQRERAKSAFEAWWPTGRRVLVKSNDYEIEGRVEINAFTGRARDIRGVYTVFFRPDALPDKLRDKLLAHFGELSYAIVAVVPRDDLTFL